VDWLLNERWIGASRSIEALRYRFEAPGEQRLIAIDANGRCGRIALRVLE
jgi:membrane carboxypeptidase/penicillin-binding protein PbpC